MFWQQRQPTSSMCSVWGCLWKTQWWTKMWNSYGSGIPANDQILVLILVLWLWCQIPSFHFNRENLRLKAIYCTDAVKYIDSETRYQMTFHFLNTRSYWSLKIKTLRAVEKIQTNALTYFWPVFRPRSQCAAEGNEMSIPTWWFFSEAIKEQNECSLYFLREVRNFKLT